MQRAFILAPSGESLTASESAFFREVQPWGFILFARNVVHPDQVRRLTNDLRHAVGRNASVSIDQEGGRVQRLRPPHWTQLRPPLDMAQQARLPKRAFYLHHRLIAAELHAIGIDINCAPCCDIAQPDTHPFLRNRCFGTDPDQVIRNARAACDGLLDGGVLPVLKHMPGHGRGRADSHIALPVADVSLGDAAQWDFRPFRALHHMPIGMSAHIIIPEAGSLPATQNPVLIDKIRNDIGFDGLLLSDDLSMEALSGPLTERAKTALAAGCDLVLHCNGDFDQMQALATAVGPMSAGATRRADAALAMRKRPDPVDSAMLLRELDRLFHEA